MSSEKEKVNREYLNNYVNPILEKLVYDLLVSKPKEVIVIVFSSQILTKIGRLYD